MAPSNIVLRPATPDDADYVYGVTQDTMRDYCQQTWGVWNESEQRQRTIDNINSKTCSIISHDRTDIGILVVERHPTHILLARIFIAPVYQGHGLGTRIITQLMEEAAREGVPLRLRVLAVNPARRLYERLGFVITKSTAERYEMEFRR